MGGEGRLLPNIQPEVQNTFQMALCNNIWLTLLSRVTSPQIEQVVLVYETESWENDCIFKYQINGHQSCIEKPFTKNIGKTEYYSTCNTRYWIK